MTLIDKAEALRVAQEASDNSDSPQDVVAAIDALPARGVRVKQLQWKQAGGDIKAGDGFSAWPDLIHTPVTIYRKRDGWWLNLDCKTHPTLDAAKAAAQADYEARILAALEPALAPTDAAQAPFRIEDMTLADLMRDPLYEEATTPAPAAAQAREAALREAAAAVRARYMGDNNREDQEVLRCEAAILALIGDRP